MQRALAHSAGRRPRRHVATHDSSRFISTRTHRGHDGATRRTRRAHWLTVIRIRRCLESRLHKKPGCALCGAKEVTEPRGEERYCRDCWDKKIAVEEIVAREFALKRYIRAHSAEKYLVYHSDAEAAVRPD